MTLDDTKPGFFAAIPGKGNIYTEHTQNNLLAVTALFQQIMLNEK